MTTRRPRRLAPTLLLVSGLAGGIAPGCSPAGPAPGAAAKPATPAKVEKMPGEADLTTVTLTPEAEARLKLKTEAVEARDVSRTRTLGGEVTVPPGRAIVVAAPIAGTLAAAPGGPVAPGSPVTKGQVIFNLVPLLSAEARVTFATTHVEAQGQVEQAKTQVAQAQLVLDRAERLRQQSLGGSGAVEDARAALEVSRSVLRAATTRRDAIDAAIKGVEGGALPSVPIAAEGGGLLRTLSVAPGQKVAAGATLFEVVNLDEVHVRVPVYVGDLAKIDESKPAAVGDMSYSDATLTAARPARRVSDPPAGDPLAATIDLFYTVDNKDGALRPGQRVGVALPLKGNRAGLVVPLAALLRDFDGGAWVYESIGSHKYARRRVRVEGVDGPNAILASGPKAGAMVVTDGAAEVFGSEFGSK